MVLAREVMRPEKPDGPPLFGKGAVLSASQIERLAAIGVRSVVVEGRPVVVEGEEPLDEQLRRLERRLSRASRDPFMERLRDALCRHLTRIMEG